MEILNKSISKERKTVRMSLAINQDKCKKLLFFSKNCLIYSQASASDTLNLSRAVVTCRWLCPSESCH